MKIQKNLLFVLFILSVSCGEKISTSVDCDQNGPPVFVTRPTTKSGTSSFDFIFSLDQKATIYYVVYKSDKSSITSEQIKEEALSTVANAEVLSKKVVDVACADIAEVVITADQLPASQAVFAYLVAESNSLDEILKDSPVFMMVEMLERQPVATFNSTAESREVLYLVYQPDAALKSTDETFPAIIF